MNNLNERQVFGISETYKKHKTKAKAFKNMLIVQINKMYTVLSHVSSRQQINQLVSITLYRITKYVTPFQ